MSGDRLLLLSATILPVNYYDDYSFLGTNGFPVSTDAGVSYESSAESDGFGKRYAASARGLLTGTLMAVLNGSTPTYLYSVMYYDERGRVVQSKSANHLPGGVEKEYMAYNFTNQLTKRKHVHSATGKTTQTELYDYKYDHAGRLEETTHQLTEGTTVKPPMLLVFNVYDELGRLKQSGPNNMISIASGYSYNVRSWLKGIKTILFKETLTFSYSGNIATQEWTQAGKTRNYSFGYDALSRLTAATYSDNETATGSAKPNYSTSYGYDKQGNITRILRYGNTGTTTYGAIDRLRLDYSGNQLLQVTDSAANPTLSASADFRKISTAAGTTYAYDANGNMKRDPNKGITNIEYNVLNLPLSVAINNTLGQITNTYVYTAGGKKLSVSKGSFKTDYVGNMIYENGVLKRILVDNGYYENGMYYFYVRDHLGNNRVVADQNGNIVQSTQYYPFGMAFADGLEPSRQPYKYSDKELDSDRGLNLYDHGARYRGGDVPTFLTMDPLAEKYYSISPYAYCLNNPIRFIDLNGREPIRPYIGTAMMFKLLLNNSPSGVGYYTGKQAANYLKSLGNTEWSWKQMRPLPTQTGYFNMKAGRYIYTEKGGWLDMSHFMFYAGKAYEYKLQKQAAEEVTNSSGISFLSSEAQSYWRRQANIDPTGESLQDGYRQELSDKLVAPYSAYSYEDLPSDRFGADFGANYFDPNSKLTFAEQLYEYLKGLGATDPKNAPNYKSLPDTEPKERPTRINKGHNPVYTKDNP